MHIYRFLTSPGESTVTIDGSEWHHLHKVLRLPVGTPVEVFDGAGWVAQGRIQTIAAKSAQISIEQVYPKSPDSPPLILCLGALKGNSWDELLPALVELGVDALHLFLPEGVAKQRVSHNTQERWHRILLASVKQCKRPRMPTITSWSHSTALLEEVKFPSQTQRWLLAPEARQPLGEGVIPMHPTALVVGSEKGLSSQEQTQFTQAGFVPVSMGTSILRATTAAIGAAAVLSQCRFHASAKGLR